jgi:hypothetical protein
VSRIVNPAAAAAAAGLDEPAPGGRFRRTVRINLVAGTLATGVEIEPGTRLAAEFLPREANVLVQTAAERAMLSAGNTGLTVALPVARRIARIWLVSTEPGDQIAAFRFDGPVVSEQPVATAQSGALLGVTDRQLLLRRLRRGSVLPLAAAEVAGLFVAYDAPNPRVGFALPDDGAGAEFLTAQPAVPGAPGAAAELALGASFAASLSARIGRFAQARQAPLPNPLPVDLILEADHPCLGRIAAFDLRYVLTLRGLADSSEKEVLRFPGSRPAVERLQIRLPSNANVLSAAIALSESAGPKRRRIGATEADGAAPAASGEAVALLPGSLVASRIDLPEARVVTGAEARLAAVESATAVASLWEDDGQGLPGRRLAQSPAVALESGHPMSIAFVFSQPEALPAGPAWLVFSLERGRAALALGAGAPGGVAIHSGTGFAVAAAAGARSGAARLLYAADPAGEAEPSAGLTVSLDGAAVALERDGELEGLRADLRPRLNAMPRPRPERIEIEIASERKSVVTVDPPLIFYEEAT